MFHHSHGRWWAKFKVKMHLEAVIMFKEDVRAHLESTTVSMYMKVLLERFWGL